MLKELLQDWTDFDRAQHALAVCLGLMPDDWEWVLQNAKWVFWSSNPTGEILGDLLNDLVDLGVVEKDEDGRFRYSRRFVAPWETPSQS